MSAHYYSQSPAAPRRFDSVHSVYAPTMRLDFQPDGLPILQRSLWPGGSLSTHLTSANRRPTYLASHHIGASAAAPRSTSSSNTRPSTQNWPTFLSQPPSASGPALWTTELSTPSLPAPTDHVTVLLQKLQNSVEENARNQRAQFQDILRQLAELQVQSGSGSLSLSTPVLDRRVSELTDRFNAVTRVPDKLADHELRNTMDEPTDVVSHCAAHSFSPADGTPEPTASPELQMRDLGAGAVHSDTMDSIYSFPSNAHVASGETQHEVKNIQFDWLKNSRAVKAYSAGGAEFIYRLLAEQGRARLRQLGPKVYAVVADCGRERRSVRPVQLLYQELNNHRTELREATGYTMHQGIICVTYGGAARRYYVDRYFGYKARISDRRGRKRQNPRMSSEGTNSNGGVQARRTREPDEGGNGEDLQKDQSAIESVAAGETDGKVYTTETTCALEEPLRTRNGSRLRV
ncbi:hypothetical protein C8R46DRAFT_1042098 [Mycena filopes]|nr:hypothetical protein C8R46DRAFT_1042098 [Mycena filopes]